VELLTFLAGAAVAVTGQWLTHRYTSSRERRGDLAKTIDRVVSAFAAGEQALDGFMATLEDWNNNHPALRGPDRATVAAAEDARVEMRASLFSLLARAGRRSDRRGGVQLAFSYALSEWEMAFLKCRLALNEEELVMDALPDAQQAATRFRGKLYGEAMDRAIGALHRA
jgi:hypothetical protein